MNEEQLKERLDRAVKKRDALASKLERLRGRRDSVAQELERIREECRKKNIDPDRIDETRDQMQAQLEKELAEFETSVETLEARLTPFLKAMQ